MGVHVFLRFLSMEWRSIATEPALCKSVLRVTTREAQLIDECKKQAMASNELQNRTGALVQKAEEEIRALVARKDKEREDLAARMEDKVAT